VYPSELTHERLGVLSVYDAKRSHLDYPIIKKDRFAATPGYRNQRTRFQQLLVYIHTLDAALQQRSRCIMHLVTRITINSIQSAVVDPAEEGERDTIHDHCTAPRQCVPDGIFAK
jgi:hypothetical protein